MVVSALIIKHKDILVCPACGGDLDIYGNRNKINCSKCNRSFKYENGIPLLFWPNEWNNSKEDVTNIIKSFYEQTPFPNYDNLDSAAELRKKAKKKTFFRLLNDEIPHDARILEIGCGTGQLSNFLGMEKERTIFATDMCLNSLRLAQEFNKKNKIENTAFLQMNLFRPAFRERSFDLVICNGVLHHTNNPFLGLQSISKLVKKTGFVIIGLYNTYGRIFTDIRRLIFRFTGNRFRFLDPRLRTSNLSEAKKHTWFMDQYRNPHETKHTIREALNWFDKSGIEFVNSIPHSRAFEPFSPDEGLFKPSSRGTKLDHFFVQLDMLFNKSWEGGFFIMIGRKKS